MSNASASAVCGSDRSYSSFSTSTDPTRSAGSDGRPVRDGNRSAVKLSGNRSRRCSARNANSLPAGTRSPAIASASSNSRSTRDLPCIRRSSQKLEHIAGRNAGKRSRVIQRVPRCSADPALTSMPGIAAVRAAACARSAGSGSMPMTRPASAAYLGSQNPVPQPRSTTVRPAQGARRCMALITWPVRSSALFSISYVPGLLPMFGANRQSGNDRRAWFAAGPLPCPAGAARRPASSTVTGIILAAHRPRMACAWLLVGWLVLFHPWVGCRGRLRGRLRHGQGDRRSLLRVAEVRPDLVQLGLVIERLQAEHERADDADHAIAAALHSGGFLHLGDPVGGRLYRDKRRDNDNPADRDREQREYQVALYALVQVAGLPVDFVPPDQVVDAERNQWPDQPHENDVPRLACTSRHNAPPVR